MTARNPRGLCATSLAVLMLAAPAAQAQMTPELQLQQAEAMGLCDPTLAPGLRLPGRLVGCTPQQAAAMGIPVGTATGAEAGGGTPAPRRGGGLMGGAGPGGVTIGGDPLNMGGPLPGPKGPGAPRGHGGGPLGGPLAGGPRPQPGTPAQSVDQAASDIREAQQADRDRAAADRAYDQMEADVLDALQADEDSAEARAADKTMRAEAAKLRAQRDADRKKAYDAQLAEYKHCRLIAPFTYDRVMGDIAAEYSREIKGAPEAGRLLQRRREEQEKAALYQRDHSCDHLDPEDVSLAPLGTGKK